VQFPITIKLCRSRFLSFLMVLLHVLAGACLWVLPWPSATRQGLLLVVALSLWHALRPSKIVGLRLGERRTDTPVLTMAIPFSSRRSRYGCVQPVDRRAHAG
jgi:hypothetical protein